MHPMQHDRTKGVAQSRELRRRGGTVLLLVAVAILGLLGVAALATDVGHLWAARTELQGAADSAALAAAANVVDPTNTVVTLPTATTNAQTYGSSNQADQKSIAILGSDLVFGNWSLATQTLDTGVDLTVPDQVTAAQVTARLDNAANGPVQTVLARIFGRDDFAFVATATGYLGFAGSFPPGSADLPITIDCCALAGSDCNDDYCSTITTNPPNPCTLANGDPVSCLEFDPTGSQNACWSEFDGQHPSINTPGLEDIIQNGNGETVSTSVPIYIDNGDKTPVVREISDKFHGTGNYSGNPSGTDRYPPFDGTSDSWVVGLPVIECQDEDHCAGGDTQYIVGAVCFEIREIIVTPDKIIKGRFLCSGDPLFQDCGIGSGQGGVGPGGSNFGVRATVPVLVQ